MAHLKVGPWGAYLPLVALLACLFALAVPATANAWVDIDSPGAYTNDNTPEIKGDAEINFISGVYFGASCEWFIYEATGACVPFFKLGVTLDYASVQYELTRINRNDHWCAPTLTCTTGVEKREISTPTPPIDDLLAYSEPYSTTPPFPLSDGRWRLNIEHYGEDAPSPNLYPRVLRRHADPGDGDHLDPGRVLQRHDADLRLQRHRSGAVLGHEVRVQARRRPRLDRLPGRQDLQHARGQPHPPGARGRQRRQRRRHAGVLLLDGRHHAAGDHRHRPRQQGPLPPARHDQPDDRLHRPALGRRPLGSQARRHDLRLRRPALRLERDQQRGSRPALLHGHHRGSRRQQSTSKTAYTIDPPDYGKFVLEDHPLAYYRHYEALGSIRDARLLRQRPPRHLPKRCRPGPRRRHQLRAPPAPAARLRARRTAAQRRKPRPAREQGRLLRPPRQARLRQQPDRPPDRLHDGGLGQARRRPRT